MKKNILLLYMVISLFSASAQAANESVVMQVMAPVAKLWNLIQRSSFQKPIKYGLSASILILGVGVVLWKGMGGINTRLMKKEA